MLFARLIWGVCFILLGILFLIMGIAGELPAYSVLAGLGLLGWGVWDMSKYIQEKRKEGEIDEMARERDGIKSRLDKEG